MRIAYLISSAISQMLYIVGAVLIPIYVTPGLFFWSAGLIFLMVINGMAVGKRMDEWNRMDSLK